MTVTLDPSDPFHARVLAALESEELGWLTTTDATGNPQPNPVWAVWAEDAIWVYSIPGQAKIRNIERNPLVSFNLHAGNGLPVFVATGPAELIPQDERPESVRTAYWAKYGALSLKHLNQDQSQFEGQYTATIRLRPAKIRGF